jgi:hypothetical protein
MTDQQKRSRPSINQEVRSSAHYFVVPYVTQEVNLLDFAAGGEGMRMPRSLAVLGDLELDGNDLPIPGTLVVQRNDQTNVVVPVNAGSVGLPFDLQAWKLLPSGIGQVLQLGDGPAITFTGTPAASASILVRITEPGGLGEGEFDWSLDGGATWEAQAVTINVLGTNALGSTGITANFADDDYVDNTDYLVAVGVTDVHDILINW